MKKVNIRLMLTIALTFFFERLFAASEIANYIRPVGTWVLALGLFVGAAGAARIYYIWGSEDKDMNSEILAWFGSCLLLIISGIAVKAFTGF